MDLVSADVDHGILLRPSRRLTEANQRRDDSGGTYDGYGGEDAAGSTVQGQF
jgi:hypothetical protein